MKEKIKTIINISPYKSNDLYYYFYKITNLNNGMFYYGIHKTNNLNDGYAGSGHILKEAINKEGISSFQKGILKFFDNYDDLLEYEKSIVNKELINNPLCYNSKRGGMGGWENAKGFVSVRDNNGKCFRVSKDDIRYTSGKLKHNCSGRVNVIEIETGKHITISKSKYNSNKDKYKFHIKGKVIVKDENGKSISITKEEYEKGNYKGQTSGYGIFKDKDGNIIQCKTDDERVLNGELVGHTKGAWDL